MRDLWKDLLSAGRRLARSPGFTAAVVLLIALGTGANFALYSVVRAVLLEPLPFTEPDRLVAIATVSTQDATERQPVSLPDFADWQAQGRSFASLAGFHSWFYNVTGGSEPERVTGGVMTANLLPTLGVRPLAGRGFAADEQGPAGKPVALLGENLWRRRFGGDPGVVGSTVRLDDVPVTVVGVLPASFDLPKGAEIWKPLAHATNDVPRKFQFLQVIGRLKPGVTVSAAQSDLATVAARLEKQYPDSNQKRGALVRSLTDELVGEVRPALVVLFGAVLLMLVLACVNVANLMLVRVQARRGEISVRLALGVSRSRLTRQFVLEGLLLSLLGCGAGLWLGVWGSRLLVAYSPREIPRLAEAHVGAPVLWFALAVALAAGVAFSVLPALWASRHDLSGTLRTVSAGSGGRGRRLIALLVVGEIAAALVLQTGAGLMIESFVRLRDVRPGFAPEGLLTMRLSLPATKYADGARTTLFASQLEERLRNLPGVRGASLALSPPMSPGPKVDNSFTIEGRPQAPGSESSAFLRPVSADYFQVMRIALLSGRAFSPRDDARAPAVAVINQEMARRFFGGENPVGRRLTTGAALGSMGKLDEVPREIVGVVGDVKATGLAKEVPPEIYFPIAQGTWRTLALVVRAARDPARLTRPVMREVWALDPNLPLSDIATMDQNVARSIAQPKLYMALLTAFAALAWALAMAGVYGVVSQAVGQRRREIGLRMALGAGKAQIFRRVLADGLKLAVLGVALGVLAAGWLSRVLEGLLFATSPRDPEAFLVVAALVALAALAASGIPAYRALRVDPLVVLRGD